MRATQERRVDRNGTEYIVVKGTWTKAAAVRELMVDGKCFEIPGEACECLRGGPNGSQHRVYQRDSVLHIIPNFHAWVVGVISTLIGVGLPVVWFRLITQTGWVSSFQQPVLGGVFVTLLCWGLGLAFAYGAVMIFTSRSRFDCHTGQATRRIGFRRAWTVPLTDIVALQCLHVGWFRLKNGWNSAYQLNLVLCQGGERLEIASDWDCRWGSKGSERRIRLLAESLAKFLRVPVVDQIDETWVREPKTSWWDG